jgi:magnesium chelatase subunit D
MTGNSDMQEPNEVPVFPFSAVVGHEDVKLALLLNAIDRRIGGVLLRGEKGSAKSTLARAVAALLPGASRFVELPISATEDRVVGSLDLKAALTEGTKRFHPGLLAEADNGVLYVDEVNLLPDHLVDVLLDVAASGINRVEREAVSESHPSRFVLVGSMNPEEGELRPQLLDRFGLTVEVSSSRDVDERVEAVQRRMTFDQDPIRFAEEWADRDSALATRLGAANPAEVPMELMRSISQLCVAVGTQGLRADIVMSRAAAALAGWEGRGVATLEDVRRVAPLVLAHRRRRMPFEDPGIEQEDIDRSLDGETEQEQPAPADDGESTAGQQRRDPARPDAPSRVVPLSAPRTTAMNTTSGRRTVVKSTRGRMIGDRDPQGQLSDIAVGATVRSAAIRHATVPSDGPIVAAEDLRQAVREQKTGNLLILVVDASASMGVEHRMEAVKGAIMSLLLDAYQRRDRVALVTFGGDEATVILRPTGSVEVARSRLVELATGGRTPLAAGIQTAKGLATGTSDTHRPFLILVSDGRATSASTGRDPVAEAMAAAAEVRALGIPSVVLDVEDGRTRLGLALPLADAMGARHVPLSELSSGALTTAIRESVTGPS